MPRSDSQGAVSGEYLVGPALADEPWRSGQLERMHSSSRCIKPWLGRCTCNLDDRWATASAQWIIRGGAQAEDPEFLDGAGHRPLQGRPVLVETTAAWGRISNRIAACELLCSFGGRHGLLPGRLLKDGALTRMPRDRVRGFWAR